MTAFANMANNKKFLNGCILFIAWKGCVSGFSSAKRGTPIQCSRNINALSEFTGILDLFLPINFIFFVYFFFVIKMRMTKCM